MRDLLTVGQFSGLCRLSVKTLHHYDEVGLLRPHHVDEVTGYRYYRHDQVHRALISLLRTLEVPVPTVVRILEQPLERDTILTAQRERLRRSASRTRQALASLERLLSGEAPTSHQVTTVVEPARRVAAVESTTSPEDVLVDSEELITVLITQLAEVGLTPERVLTYYPRGLAGHVPILAMAPIPADRECAGLDVRMLGGACCAQLIHVGPYEELPLSYHVLTTWLAEHGHFLDAAVRETYLNDPATTPADALITQVSMEIQEQR